ncbi:MAG: DUF3566 domain-containing protein [Acidimicrobiales bacterium]
MSEQTGPVIGEEPSPFPARYGPVRGDVEREALAPEPARRRRSTPAADGVAPRRAAPAGALRAPGETWVSPSRDGADGVAPAPARSVTAAGVPIRRLVRRVDAWTVFKVSLLFYLLMLGIFLLAGVVAWHVAVPLHFIRDIERAVRTLADDRTFVLHPKVVLKYAAAAGGALALLGTVMNTIAAVLYNLISDVVGGVQTIEVVKGE